MLEKQEIEIAIRKPLQKILDDLNNHVDRENYAELEKTLEEAYKLIKSVIKQKGE